jgi:hypothetical protein
MDNVVVEVVSALKLVLVVIMVVNLSLVNVRATQMMLNVVIISLVLQMEKLDNVYSLVNVVEKV